MKLVAKVLAVLGVLALATPALACGDKATTKTAEAKSSSSQTVAKSGEKKATTQQTKQSAQPKPATATN